MKWSCERNEAFLSDYQGRDLTVEAELALDEQGNFLAVRGSNLSNLGGHAAAFVSLQKGLGLMSSVYRAPSRLFPRPRRRDQYRLDHPYRSAGRPEAIFVIERLTDVAADQLGLDPVELRRQNMVPPSAQPYANPLGITYDSGRYEDAMDTALALADWDGFSARRTEARKRGKLRGIGITNYVEITSGARASAPRSPCFRRAGLSWLGARCPLGKATKPASRSSSPNGLACRSKASLTSRTTRPGLRRVAAHIRVGQ